MSKKRGKSEDDIFIESAALHQLTLHIEESLEKLKKAYEKNNREEFIQLKKAILNAQKEIHNILK